jgi:hypothetical protein
MAHVKFTARRISRKMKRAGTTAPMNATKMMVPGRPVKRHDVRLPEDEPAEQLRFPRRYNVADRS